MTSLESEEFHVAAAGPRVTEAFIAAITCLVPAVLIEVGLSSWLRWAALGPLTVVLVWSVVRALRLELRATRDGVFIQNYWRSYGFAWSEVSHVVVTRQVKGIVLLPAIGFVLADNSGVRAQATPTGANEINAVLQRLQRIAPPNVSFVGS